MEKTVPGQTMSVSSLSKPWFQRPQNIFLIIGGIGGILFCFLTPPTQVPDESDHFYRAYQVAEGKIVAEVSPHQMAGAWVPRSVVEFAEYTAPVIRNHSEKLNPNWILQQFQAPLNSEDRVFQTLYAYYSPIPYLPGSLALRLLIPWETPPIILMYAGRGAMFTTWLVLVYFSIRLIPFYKWVFLLLALTPMSLYQAASMNPDCTTIALAFLMIGYSLYLAYGTIPKVGGRELWILAIIALALSLCKNIYFVFSLLVLVIPTEKFSSGKRRFLWTTGIIGGSLFSVLLWGWVVSSLPIRWLSFVEPQEQIHLIKTRPDYFVYVLAKNVVKKFMTLSRGFVGVFGWSDIPLRDLHVFSWLAFLVWTACVDGRRDIRIGRMKILFLGLFAICMLMTFTLVYITWNPPGSDMINGLQGRYLIPAAPLLLLVFYNRRFQVKPAVKIPVILMGTVLSLALALVTLVNRFYIIP